MGTGLFKQSHELLERFSKEGWPDSVMITGTQSIWKTRTIQKAIEKSLWESRINANLSENEFEKMIEMDEHPDYYRFPAERIKIGDRKKPEKGSVRHMMEHFLMFSSKYSRERFVLFEDAATILNEAESALLKSIEEPPEHTHFILLVDEASKLKETIVSRCLEIPLNRIPDLSQTPVDPWERFWFFSEWNESTYHETMKEKGFLDIIKDSYDQLTFSSRDFLIFENLGWIQWKKTFSSESSDDQTIYLRLAFYPLYCAIRDKMIKGQAPEISPVSLPSCSYEKLRLLSGIIETFYRRIETRYFNTRIPALNTVFFGFLSRFMRIWTAKI